MTQNMTPDPTATPPKPRRPRYPVTVKSVQRLTPRMVRVTFTSPELEKFVWNGPAAHIKLIFGPDAAGQTQDAPAGSDAGRPVMRTYTPRRFNREARELIVDFVLHGEGVASTWAAQAAAGQTLTIAGPGRHYVVDPTAEWFLLAGDETAIPAISTILEVLPPTSRAFVFLEVVDAGEEHCIHAGANATVRWLHRGEDASRAGQLLEAAIREHSLPPTQGRVYVACEAGAMRRIRSHLLRERGMPADRLVTRGYWKLGEVDHPDGDYGQDV